MAQRSSPAEVEAWFAEKHLRNEPIIRRLREIILSAEARMGEVIQYSTLHLVYEGDLASFVQLSKRPVSLMFNTGARIPGDFPHLEGDGPNARFMRFATLEDVEARADELRSISQAWCRLKSDASCLPEK